MLSRRQSPAPGTLSELRTNDPDLTLPVFRAELLPRQRYGFTESGLGQGYTLKSFSVLPGSMSLSLPPSAPHHNVCVVCVCVCVCACVCVLTFPLGQRYFVFPQLFPVDGCGRRSCRERGLQEIFPQRSEIRNLRGYGKMKTYPEGDGFPGQSEQERGWEREGGGTSLAEHTVSAGIWLPVGCALGSWCQSGIYRTD
jgi:hypothetical protein